MLNITTSAKVNSREISTFGAKTKLVFRQICHSLEFETNLYGSEHNQTYVDCDVTMTDYLIQINEDFILYNNKHNNNNKIYLFILLIFAAANRLYALSFRRSYVEFRFKSNY